MQDFFYNLQGGINTAKTRVALGSETKKLYWDDAVNIDILKNTGICRQKGNRLVLKLEDEKRIVGLFEYPKNSESFVFGTEDGNIYHYDAYSSTKRLVTSLDKPISRIIFAHYLDGVVVCTDTNGGIYFEIGATEEVQPINLKNANEEDVFATSICVFASRIWISSGATLYFSALGRFNDWESSDDAGYIEKFHCSNSKITALKEYVACLALYKEDGVWLLSGSNPDEFAITRFADKGTFSHNSVLNCDNKQFFITRGGVFALEQAGDLSQISLSVNIAINIQSLLAQTNYGKIAQTFMVRDDARNQIWFFVPFAGADFINQVLIYDYFCGAWLKRVIPYEITCAANIYGRIYTASAQGEVFLEGVGNTFAGEPIKFSFSTPFFTLGKPTVRKMIENMCFIFDESHENRFKFGVSKDFISSERFDIEDVDTIQPDCLVWYGTGDHDDFDSVWSDEDDKEKGFLWADPLEEAYKTDIFDSNTSVQLHIQGGELGDDFAIVGIEFKEVLFDGE